MLVYTTSMHTSRLVHTANMPKTETETETETETDTERETETETETEQKQTRSFAYTTSMRRPSLLYSCDRRTVDRRTTGWPTHTRVCVGHPVVLRSKE